MKSSSPPLKLDSQGIIDAKRKLSENTANNKHLISTGKPLLTDNSLNKTNCTESTNDDSSLCPPNDYNLDTLPTVDAKFGGSVSERQRKTAIMNKVSDFVLISCI